MDIKKLDQTTRNSYLKAQLHSDIVKLLDKHHLRSTPEGYWVSTKENCHEQIVFKQSYLLKNDIIRALFRLNRLCFAKINYFAANIDQFKPYIYRNGFIKTGWWDAEFLKHVKSSKLIDFRYLQTITDIEVFRGFCRALERI